MTRPVRPAILTFCDRLLSATGRGMLICAMIFLGCMTLLIAIQVVSRNFFNMGLPWADELARFTGLGLVFFTIPRLQYQGKHIAVDIFSSRLTGVVGRIAGIINEVAVLALLVLMLISFNSFLQRAAHFATPATGMPNWVFYAPALIGIVVCTLITVLRVLFLCLGQQPGESQSPTIEEQLP